MSNRPHFLTPKELSERWRGVVTLRTIYSWTQKPHRGPKRATEKGVVAFLKEDVEYFEHMNSRLMVALAKRAEGRAE